MELRPALPEDRPSVMALLASAMDRPDDSRFTALHEWKHTRNPFGRSLEWVAVEDEVVVGYRAFLRWEFSDDVRTFRAVRAVDTATDPAHQGKGIFRTLTMHALDAARADGVDFVFNTPNDQSRPGYLKMGWELLGVLRPGVRPRSLTAVPTVLRGRVPAAHWGEPSSAGQPAADVFSDDARTQQLLAASRPGDGQRSTQRSPAYLRWRYGGDLLGYRVLTLGDDLAEGAACFRVRRRGPALEATIGDLLVPDRGAAARRRLIGKVLKASGAHYALVLDATWRDLTLPVPGQGPTLTWRSLVETDAPPIERWALTMGDIELF